MSQAYVLVPEAERDLRNIIAYSERKFGLHQTIVLKETLDRTLMLLCSNPELGHVREDLSPPQRSLLYHTVKKRFCIVYDPDTEPLRIARILNGRMLTALHLKNV